MLLLAADTSGKHGSIALAVATTCFIIELEASDPALGAQLKPLLQEFGAPQHVA